VYKFQLISFFHSFFKISLTLEKCLHQEKFLTEKGEGWADSKAKCFDLLIKDFFHFAKFPQSKKITHFFSSEIFLITASVKSPQPIFEWDAGFHFSTVKIAFKRKTHCFAHFSKFQDSTGSIHKSSFNSL